MQGFQELLGAAFFDRVFSLHGARSIRVLLFIDQFPGSFLFCVLGSYLVVVFKSGSYVLRGPDIVGSVFEASEDIDKNRHAQI